MPHLFCFGLGYSAQALIRRLDRCRWRISGTCRSEEAAAALRAEGIEVTLFDRAHPPAAPEAGLAGISHILSSVPPDEAGDPVLDSYGPAIARRPDLAWLG